MGVLWLRELALRRSLPLAEIPGTYNPGDLFTNYIRQEVMERYMKVLGMHYLDSRAALAPNVYSREQPDKQKASNLWM